MSNLSITVEVLPGTDVTAAAREAVALANHLRVAIRYNFNGVLCLAVPGDDHELLAEKCMSMVGVAIGRQQDAQ